jgi:hypothetical protein
MRWAISDELAERIMRDAAGANLPTFWDQAAYDEVWYSVVCDGAPPPMTVSVRLPPDGWTSISSHIVTLQD